MVCEYATTADLADGLALLQVHRPGLELLRLALLGFHVHTLIGMALFTIWPFTRLVRAFTAPLQYLFRPYIVYRSRDGGPTARPVRRGWERV